LGRFFMIEMISIMQKNVGCYQAPLHKWRGVGVRFI
jgi:hypothetical protein